EETRVHVHGRYVRVGHVRDEADSGREEARVLLSAGNALGEFRAELAADGRDVDPDLLEHPTGHLPAHAAASGLTGRVGTVPRRVDEGGLGAGLPLDLLEHGADAVAQGFEPV